MLFEELDKENFNTENLSSPLPQQQVLQKIKISLGDLKKQIKKERENNQLKKEELIHTFQEQEREINLLKIKINKLESENGLLIDQIEKMKQKEYLIDIDSKSLRFNLENKIDDMHLLFEKEKQELLKKILKTQKELYSEKNNHSLLIKFINEKMEKLNSEKESILEKKGELIEMIKKFGILIPETKTPSHYSFRFFDFICIVVISFLLILFFLLNLSEIFFY